MRGGGASVDQYHRLSRDRCIAGSFVGILQREGGHIHHHRIEFGFASHGGVVANHLFLCRHQQHLRLARDVRRAQRLIVDLDLIAGERYVLLGLDQHLPLEFIGRERRNRDLLDDHRVARDGDGHVAPPDAQPIAKRAQGIHHRALVHDRAVDDGVRWNRLDPEGGQFTCTTAERFDLRHLDGTRTEV